ncbi:Na+/H+ antiporter subunit D [Fictibacillus phosphorivorans]|uniref:Na+/H+ antiporter subunit D n=1 Tax=Fictibacillus phosphorivorans TaxID=1221500 RepID=UPI002041135F|nr:Na+/H+ antiporter subunit D [Fictibacillus phosphorivorans]MCM3716911.1 Na+/H+ antiporter subunit D [Fictibacillus phosphorivorans]MCM3774540.1 Na+/H+ antiporter subunit D [Fictibacillus phosphorivorans]
MSNLVFLPIFIPLFVGALLVFLKNRHQLTIKISYLTVLLNLGLSIFLSYFVFTHHPLVLETGGWKAPFGIILVADKLSVIMTLSVNVIALASVIFASSSVTSKMTKHYFYPLFFILIAGVSGAFLTGDLFNLFVFFEVLLMASYGLIIIGGSKQQFRESVKYILLNLFSSILFVTTVAFLYSVTGTVNMAQLGERVAEVEQQGILTGIAILLFVVFATKGALFPLYFWLPKSYIVPSPVVSALFGALLTKVGVYSMLRVYTLIFSHKLELTHTFFIWVAAITMLIGVIGALSTSNVKLIIAYNIMPAIGFMLLGIGTFSAESLAGTIYYLIHDMAIKAALFFLAGLLVWHAGTSNLNKMGGYIKTSPLLGWMFFIAALILAGIPPFSGFIGKYLLLRGAFDEEHYFVAGIGLLSSLLILFSVIRIFIGAFWGELKEPKEKVRRSGLVASGLLIAISILLGVGAEWFYPYIQSAADNLIDPQIYIDFVLKE